MTNKRDLRLRVNEKLYAELMRWSAEELRSMNGLVEYLLTEAVKKRYGRTGEKPGGEGEKEDK